MNGKSIITLLHKNGWEGILIYENGNKNFYVTSIDVL